MQCTRFPSLATVCRFWTVVFVIVGLGFALTPQLIAELLNRLAATLGLTPGIPTGRDSLWYMLALSLMATLAYLSWEAARPQAPPTALRAVLLSKMVSTAGFVMAALTLASGWLLGAVADGFVALTLLLAWRCGARGESA